jgi:hypothetical protein
LTLSSVFVVAQPGQNPAITNNPRTVPDWVQVKTLSTTVQIDAGENFWIKFDNGTLGLEAEPPVDLPVECDTALTMVPNWLVDNLTYKFRKLDASHQVEMANLIINSPDPNYRDEIAFCIAHLAPEALQHEYFFADLLTENAQYIYQNDQYLDYVEVVEKSDYTTLSYKNKTEVALELPRDIYYWYIVHPKLSDELPTYVDPDHNFKTDPPLENRNYGVLPPTGKFWRNWLFYENDTGKPLLKDYLSSCTTIWEAVSKCSHWVKDSMSFTSDAERPIQPVRIYRKHIGRCGEHQDLACAAGRAALVPLVCTSNMAEDHVWNEFWDQRWVRWDANSKDNIDNWKYDTDMGGGKTCSTIWNNRGDSYTYSALSRYSDTCTFTATVVDSNGLPVDGSDIMVLSDDFYQAGAISVTTWGTTDYTGTCTFELGNSRDFYASAESDNLGEDPPDQGGEMATQVILDSQSDATYSAQFNLPQAAPKLKATTAALPSDPLNKYKMEVSYSVLNNILQGYNIYTGEHSDIWNTGGNIDFFISDNYNFDEYDAGRTFEAYGLKERISDNDTSLSLPSEDNWYAVLSNEFAQRSTKTVNITVKLYGMLTGEIISPENNDTMDLDSTVTITGTAFSPIGVSSVEIDIDNADDWELATSTSRADWDTWKFDWDTTGLAPGLHNVRARFSDFSYSFIEQIDVTLIDVTDPTISFNEPLNDTEFSIGSIVEFNGPANDNVGITLIKLMMDDDLATAVDITSSLTSGEWHYELYTDDIDDGDHTLTVSIFDAANNSASNTIYFTLVEVIAPEVSITSPANNSLLKLGEDYYIQGLATDNKAVKILQVIIDDNDPINITTSLMLFDNSWAYYWDTGDGATVEGEHTIEVQAYDAAWNIGTAKIFIDLDGTPPDVNITNPLENTIFAAGDDIVIQGTTDDDYGIDTVEITLGKDDPINITDSLIYDEWEYDEWDTEDLKSGKHTITVTVWDLKGHTQETSIDIMIDAEVPVGNIDDILEPVLIGDSITFTGTASDDMGVEELELQIGMVDPINITPEFIDGTWSFETNTSDQTDGDLMITLKVTDIVGKVGTAEITVKIISLTTDTDDDGMPDWWELEYGLNENKDDAELDRDRDGATNLEEYLGDDGQPGNDDYSDPRNSGSTPEVKSADGGDEADLTLIWIILVIVVIIILVLTFFMMLKKKKQEEDEMEREMIDMVTETPGLEPAPAQMPMMFPPPQTMTKPKVHPRSTPTQKVETDTESDKLLAATVAQSAMEKIEIAKEQGVDTTRAGSLLIVARKALKTKKYDIALKFSQSKDEIDKLIQSDEEFDEE